MPIRDKTRILGHQKADNIKFVRYKPSDNEGNNGDLAIGTTSNGTSLFAKVNNKWYEFASEESISKSSVFKGTLVYDRGYAYEIYNYQFIPIGGVSQNARSDLTEAWQGYNTVSLAFPTRIHSFRFRINRSMGTGVYFELFKRADGADLIVDEGANTYRYEVTSPQAYTQNSIMYTVYFNNLITLEKNTTFAMRWQGTGTDISMNFSLLLDVDIPIG